MTKKIRSIALILFVFCLSATVFAQQETGRISGTVTDPTGAVVPNATVTVTSARTGFTRTTTTNEDGSFIITNLQPSNYQVSVTSGNFQEFKANADVAVAGDVVVNATLSATAGQTIVDVTAGAGDVAEVNVSDQVISEVVSTKQIENLPTITRDPYGFIVTLGNVSTAESGGRGVGANINGQRAASTNVLLNGGENVDTFTASAGQSVPLDSVQEFRVATGTFTAEFGRATGGVVNLVTKSGRNEFFGSLYAFNRNSRFSSAGFDQNARASAGVAPRQFFNRNQFGGSLGGPIIKNKLLFFTNTELTRIRSKANVFALVPTAASIAAAAPATRAFFAGYNLAATPTGRTQSITATSGRVLTFDEVQYSVAANTGAGTPVDGVQSANRIDFNVTDRFQIYGVYALDKSTTLEGSNANSPYAGFSTNNTVDNTNAQVVGTYQLSNSFVGATRFTFNKLDRSDPLGSQPTGPTLYLRSTATRLGGTRIAFPGYLPFNPGSAIPFGGPQKVFNLAQEFNYNVGDHLFKFGGQYYRILDNRVFGAFQNSVQTLGTTNANAAENFFNGVLFSFQGAANPQGRFPGQTLTLPVSQPQFGRNNRYSEFNLYAQDSFKLFPGFTANLGLRYEYYGPQRNADPKLDSNFYFGGDQSVTPANIRSGTVQIAPNSPQGELWAPDKNNFAPSVGFAYDIEGNGKSSIRAGYALRYERNFGNVTFNVIQNPPNYGVVSIQSADIGGAAIPITRSNAGPLAGSVGSVVLPRVSLRAVDPNIQTAYAHQYSASFERRFGDITASAVFSGTTGRNLYSIANINRFGSGTTHLGSTASCPGLVSVDRINGCYGNINFRGNGGRSSYQGITFSLESGNLLKTGLTIASRYTYSVSRDNLSSSFSETGNQFNLGFLDPFNPSLDYGFADFDVRHRSITNFVWDIPTRRLFNEGIGRTIFGNITLSGIVEARTGTPFSIYDCTDANDVCRYASATGPVNFKGKLGNSVGVNEFEYLRTTGLTPVSIGVVPSNNGSFPAGMLERNSFREPGFYNIDLALQKKFFFTETTNLQLRIDAVNVTNNATPSVNGFSGGTDVSSGNVVTVSKFGRRQLQFGIRFAF